MLQLHVHASWAEFIWILEKLESPGILLWHFPGLESPGKRQPVLESSGNLLNSSNNWILRTNIIRNVWQRGRRNNIEILEVKILRVKLCEFWSPGKINLSPWKVLEKYWKIVSEKEHWPWLSWSNCLVYLDVSMVACLGSLCHILIVGNKWNTCLNEWPFSVCA